MSTTRRRPRRRTAVLGVTATFLLTLIPVMPVAANSTAQTLPFGENWTDISRISLDGNWDNIPGIVGYRGDDLTTATGTNPQTLLADGSGTPVNVEANETNPTTFTTGGVAEFHLTDPTIALNGSGTADAPHIVLNLDTTGSSGVRVAYNLRDLDASTDNAVMPVALQYRVGASGNYTNLPDAFVADATDASAATLVTPVNVVLPAAASNQPLVQVRIITANAVGNDEWVGIDDIVVADVAPLVQATTPADAQTGVEVDSDITVTFSEPVDVTGDWFTVVCSQTSNHLSAASGGPTTYTINPVSDFGFDESCTLTIVAANVTDSDTSDLPDAMAVDYVATFDTGSAVDSGAPEVDFTTPADGDTDVPPSADITVDFSEPVDVTGAWYTVVCTSSGAHSAAASTGTTVFTLNPDTDFTPAESCTLTIVAGNVTDTDALDPPDTMDADYTATFTIAAAPPATPAVFFSEYIEGSSNNKALEIYNGTGAPLDLTAGAYSVQMFFNGAVTPGLTINLAGTVAPYDVYVVANASANATILAQADQTNGSGWYNGDDAVTLRTGTTVLDVIGHVGVDPGTEWGSGLTSTADNTLRRKATITVGDAIGNDAFDPAVEWDGFAIDTIDGLGWHGEAPRVATTTPAAGAIGVALASNVSITFSEPVDVAGSWFTISCATSGAHSASVSGGPTTYDLNPDTDFVNGESCTVTVAAAHVSDQDTNDPPDTMAVDHVFSFATMEVVICGDPATFIHGVQGNGATSPLVGSIVTVEGIVVGDFQGPDQFGGFYVQEEPGDTDADALTSEGVFVFSSSDVSIGDNVRVKGTVTEFATGSGTLTELTTITGLAICSTGSTLPATPVNLPVTAITDLERYEGMYVTLPQTLVIAEYFNYGRFGEIVLAQPLAGETRPFTPTAIDAPGAPALARAQANSLRRITLDDGLNSSNPEFLRHPNGAAFSTSNLFRGGDTVQDTTGVLTFGFSLYRIQPTAPATYAPANPRPDAPEPVGGNVRVAAMNTLNFFVTLDATASDTGPGPCGANQNLDCRGADSDQPTEFTRQRDKLLAALSGLDADVIGLNELESTPGAEPLASIVAGLPGYAYIDTGPIGTDAIKVGLIYRPTVVTPVGSHAILTGAVDPRFIDTKSRPALAQTFELLSNGARFTVVVNHLKSKGSDCNDVGDPDAGDGQGNCNGTRTQAAEALVDWIATDPTGSGDPDFLIMGDLNSYAMEDPITAIKAGSDDTPGSGDDYTNLIAQFQGPFAYSYTFDGMAGYLDHALANASMAGQVVGAADWHINSDETSVVDYDTTFKGPNQEALYELNGNRSSDHDPVIVGLQLRADPTVDAGGPYAVVEGGSVTVSATGSEPDGGALTYAWDLDDNGSFETPGQSPSFSAAGLQAPATKTIHVQVTGPSGLTATDTATVKVIWAFTEFKKPIKLFPAVNEEKAETHVHLKFTLGGNQGLGIFLTGFPASQQYVCGTTPPSSPTSPVQSPVHKGLTFDAKSGEYMFDWVTEKSWKGTCRVFFLGLADGTTHNIAFRFK